MRFLVLGVLFLASCAAASSDLSERLQNEPTSWATLDTEPLNERVEMAVAGEEPWPRSPLLVTLHLIGADDDARELVLEEIKNRGEGADSTKVVCIRDGLLDDSVRGDWHEFDLKRLPDGTWRVSTAKAAYRCRRSSDTDVYEERPCP
jgi:hypothetical protein